MTPDNQSILLDVHPVGKPAIGNRAYPPGVSIIGFIAAEIVQGVIGLPFGYHCLFTELS